MKFLEKDLEQIIYESSNKLLREKGLNIRGKKYRQLRIGNYGIADIISVRRYEDCLYINIYELKKDKAGISAFLQAIRYAKGIKDYLEHRDFSHDVKFGICLIAKEIDTTSDYIYLEQFTSNSMYGVGFSLRNYSYKYDIDGIKFTPEENYSLIEKGF